MSKAANKKRLHESLDRFADLFEYGQLHLSTDPSSLFEQASDEIVAVRRERDALREACRGVIDLIDNVRDEWIGGYNVVKQMRALLPEPEEGGEE